MKVLGQAGVQYMLLMTKDELDRVAGPHADYAHGEDLDVGQVHEQVTHLFKNKNKLETASANLKQFASNIDAVVAGLAALE